MLHRLNLSSKLGRNTIFLVVFTALFAVAYAQSPLYTSNQNQYFLHGLAHSSLGFLENDWLANTMDPTPVFSALVEVTFRITQLEILFFVYYAILMGIYLFSLLGIATSLFAPANDAYRNLYLLLIAGMLIAIHSAALRFVLSRILGVNWTYIFEDGMADQRILGPVFQPSTFGVLLVASIYLFLNHKPYLAVLIAALAATFHPTYLLSAAVLTFIYMLLNWKNERKRSKTILIGTLALLSVAPILLYTFTSFGGISSEAADQAREIVVNYRIPHHAQVDQWLDSTVAVKTMLILAALYLTRRSVEIFWILLGSSLVAGLLTIIQMLLGDNFLALLFPWRLSIYIVPLSTTIILAAVAARIINSRLLSVPGRVNFFKILSCTAIILAVVIGAVRFKLDNDRKRSDPQQALFLYIYAHKQPGDLYLTPIKMQDFRLASGAPVYIDFKSIPYKDTDVLEWFRRVQLADGLYKTSDCDRLSALVKESKITHVVVETSQVSFSCIFLEKTYQDQNFTLLKIDQNVR